MNEVLKVTIVTAVKANVPAYIGMFSGPDEVVRELKDAYRAAAAKLAKKGIYLTSDPETIFTYSKNGKAEAREEMLDLKEIARDRGLKKAMEDAAQEPASE